MLICFTGMDGSGKTGHILELKKFLSSQGIEVEYVWIRWVPLLLRPWIYLFKKAFFKGEEDKGYANYRDEKRKLFKGRFRSIAWRNLVLFDYLLQVLCKIQLRLLRGKVILCDRYYFDTVVDFAVDFGYSEENTAKILRNPILRFFPRPDLTILLDVEENVAFSRKDDVTSIEQLKDRRKRYLEIAKSKGIVLLENDNFTKVQEKIRRLVFKSLEECK